MFVRYFLELPLPAGRVQQAPLDSPAIVADGPRAAVSGGAWWEADADVR